MTNLTVMQAQALGMDDSHLVDGVNAGFERLRVHADAADELNELRKAAAADGFQLKVASGHRDFERQLAIFNAKARGERPVLDNAGAKRLNINEMSHLECLNAILRWSALPGASRHHWGTDFDVYDGAAVDEDYRVQLTPMECEQQFGRFHSWLDEALPKFGFFRPYGVDRGGIAPERWHISHEVSARVFQREISPGLLRSVLADSDIELKQTIVDNIDPLYRRFIEPIDSMA